MQLAAANSKMFSLECKAGHVVCSMMRLPEHHTFNTFTGNVSLHLENSCDHCVLDRSVNKAPNASITHTHTEVTENFKLTIRTLRHSHGLSVFQMVDNRVQRRHRTWLYTKGSLRVRWH